MASTYEIILTRPDGSKIATLDDFFFFTYARIVRGVNYLQIAFPLELIQDKIGSFDTFSVDWRMEMWRSPAAGFTMRLERVFWLRKRRIYTRFSDGVKIIEYTGQGPNSLLARRIVPTAAGINLLGGTFGNTAWISKKQGPIDDMMKEIVRENLGEDAVNTVGTSDSNRDLTTTGFFRVGDDLSQGPRAFKKFYGRNVMTVLKELSALADEKHFKNKKRKRILFDMANPELNVFEFQTFAERLGADRTKTNFEFSEENQNVKEPHLEEDYFEARNVAYMGGEGRGSSRQTLEVRAKQREKLSIWNRTELFVDAGNEPVSSLQFPGEVQLKLHRPQTTFSGTFLSIPAGPNNPQSLYGVDWDLGDHVNIDYAGEQFKAEIQVVYVSVNQQGEETVTGRQSPN